MQTADNLLLDIRFTTYDIVSRGHSQESPKDLMIHANIAARLLEQMPTTHP